MVLAASRAQVYRHFPQVPVNRRTRDAPCVCVRTRSPVLVRCLPGWFAGGLVGWLVGWLVVWLIRWLAGWLVGWLAG